MQTPTVTSPTTRAQEFALSARKLLEDLKDLEAGMIASNEWQQCPRRTSFIPPSHPHRRSLLRRASTLPSCYQSSFSQDPLLNRPCSATLGGSIDKKQVSGEFVTFCEHLLYKNRIWKQERQISALRTSIKAIEKAKCSNAFNSFCDRLLLTNRIWQLEKQVQELTVEGERDKRAKAAAITRAAQQMATDVRKEALIEEFVIELTQELRESKEEIDVLREEYELDTREIQGDWLKEYRRLVRENEQLRLERHARLVEQEISNELEQSLVETVEWSRQRIQELEDRDGDSTLAGDTYDEESLLSSDSSCLLEAEMDDDLDVEEGMSTISSATCVSIQEMQNQPTKSEAIARRQRHGGFQFLNGSLPRKQCTPPRKLDTTPYAGFSFNPLFFGSRETLVVSPSRSENIEPSVRLMLKPEPSSALPTRQKKDSTTKTSTLVGPTTTREPWRF